MPDFLLFAEALLGSTVVASMVLLAATWPGKSCAAWRQNLGWTFSLAAGIYTGCGLLGEWPRWPAPEDRDRFLVILLPLAFTVETAARCLPGHWTAKLLRLGVAAAAAPILLHNSVYLADLSGPNSAEWSPSLAGLILLGLTILLASVWALLARLQSRTSDQTVTPVLVLVALAAGISVMLSGYYRGGLLGLPLAGALAGAMWAAQFRGLPLGGHCLGIGILGIFTVVLVGRFFGSLPTGMAICLLFAPLAAWGAELPALRRARPILRGAVRWACVVIPLIGVVTWAQIRFTQAISARSVPKQSLSPER